MDVADRTGPWRRGSRPQRRWLLPVAAAGIATAALLALGLGPSSEKRALVRMSPEQRRPLYEESLRHVQAICSCAGSEAVLRDRCVESIRFLSAFPECDDACRTVIREHEPKPMR
jgi:hypothetical protein